jgi:hypothetical protein
MTLWKCWKCYNVNSIDDPCLKCAVQMAQYDGDNFDDILIVKEHVGNEERK